MPTWYAKLKKFSRQSWPLDEILCLHPCQERPRSHSTCIPSIQLGLLEQVGEALPACHQQSPLRHSVQDLGHPEPKVLPFTGKMRWPLPYRIAASRHG